MRGGVTHMIRGCAGALVLAALACVPAAASGETAVAPPVQTTTLPAEAPPAATVPGEAPAAPPTPASPGTGGEAEPGQSGTETVPVPVPPAGARPAPGGAPAKHAAGKRASGRPPRSRARAGKPAAPPSTLTPALPFSLESTFGALPSFFAESFRFPPFLLPIYEAAGTAYEIPWQVLAAINEVETDYGRDLSVSSAGAEGWMQFLPAEWAQFGVDANGDGYMDPYNPADAIFAAARYLHAAGGARDIRGAVFAYNHSQAYVASVMLRAQLLGGTPPELLGAVSALTDGRFPVYAPSHFSDGFPTVPGRGKALPQAIPATTIYSQPGAPVIAVQDAEVMQIGSSPQLGRFVVLRDAFGNTYTYAELGQVAPLYPVLQPHVHSAVSARVRARAAEPAPSGPATAGVQPRSPLSETSIVSGMALGATAGLEAHAAQPAPPAAAVAPAPAPKPPRRRFFREGAEDVYLHSLSAGSQVIAGTVLGHVGGDSAAGEAHILFQIRPAGSGAPMIDPKPVLDGWVALENSSVFRARGENPFLGTSPSAGQVLLESKRQLETQVLGDGGIHLTVCGRADVRGGGVDERVLAALEYLSVSGERPTVTGLRCGRPVTGAAALNTPASSAAQAIRISAVNGVPIAGHQGAGSITDETVRRLLMLQGLARPQRITSLLRYPGSRIAAASPRAGSSIGVAFRAARRTRGRVASVGAGAAELPADVWVKLLARLGEIPDPAVSRTHSSAAIRDDGAGAGAGSEHGNH
jgi:Transglycosylase SLT domain